MIRKSAMPTESASAIVFNEDSTQVLLVKREDFRIWGLPGGGIARDESHEDGAVRETREETGYEIKVDRLVARYWHPQAPRGGNRQYAFKAHIIGGAAISRGPETAAVGFFSVFNLPSCTTPWTKKHIKDALESSSAFERTEYLPIWMFLLLRDGIYFRDIRNKYILRRK
jgi:ADP-ribose pyrophosphatase YjhB (NUDIX family)